MEIDPSEKQELYDALTRDGMTLKQWFLRRAGEYLRERGQRQLFSGDVLAEDKVPHRAGDAGQGKAHEKVKAKRRAG